MDREQVSILYAMDTFKQMRTILIEKTLSKDPDIYLGLHSIGNNLSETYMERSQVCWLLEHFELYKSIIDKKISTNDKKYRKECVEYFSRVFRDFLELNGKSFADSNIAIDLLKELEGSLDSMISFSENWEKGYDQLCVMMAKNREKYKKMKKEMMEV